MYLLVVLVVGTLTRSVLAMSATFSPSSESGRASAAFLVSRARVQHLAQRELDCLVVETLTIVLSFRLTFSRTRSTVEAGRTSLQSLMRKASTSREATRLAFAASI